MPDILQRASWRRRFDALPPPQAPNKFLFGGLCHRACDRGRVDDLGVLSKRTEAITPSGKRESQGLAQGLQGEPETGLLSPWIETPTLQMCLQGLVGPLQLILHRVLTDATRRALHVRVTVRRRLVMKACSVIGLLFAAAILATIPISPQVTPRGVELSVDQAQAQITYRRARVTARREGRRAYRYERRAYRRGY